MTTHKVFELDSFKTTIAPEKRCFQTTRVTGSISKKTMLALNLNRSGSRRIPNSLFGKMQQTKKRLRNKLGTSSTTSLTLKRRTMSAETTRKELTFGQKHRSSLKPLWKEQLCPLSSTKGSLVTVAKGPKQHRTQNLKSVSTVVAGALLSETTVFENVVSSAKALDVLLKWDAGNVMDSVCNDKF